MLKKENHKLRAIVYLVAGAQEQLHTRDTLCQRKLQLND